MSKGSVQRPYDREKWDAGWDLAFGKDKTVSITVDREGSVIHAITQDNRKDKNEIR